VSGAGEWRDVKGQHASGIDVRAFVFTSISTAEIAVIGQDTVDALAPK
jgi:hypothetical protein